MEQEHLLVDSYFPVRCWYVLREPSLLTPPLNRKKEKKKEFKNIFSPFLEVTINDQITLVWQQMSHSCSNFSSTWGQSLCLLQPHCPEHNLSFISSYEKCSSLRNKRQTADNLTVPGPALQHRVRRHARRSRKVKWRNRK